MTLAERLEEHVRACFTAIWVRSAEPDDALEEIAGLCLERGWALAAWDLERGLVHPGRPDGAAPSPTSASDPLAAVRVTSAPSPGGDGTSLLVLRNFHRFLGGAEVAQAVEARVAAGKAARAILVVLSPVVQLPPELERRFVVLEHDLPGRDQLSAIARGVATDPGELPEGDGLEAVLDAAAGLTRVEAEDAFSLSLVRHGRLDPSVLWELKARALEESGLLTLHRGGGRFADLGGLDALKAFCSRALRRGTPPSARARGVLLLGVPGTGKSHFARALGSETGRPTLALDVGSLMGSLVGETERRVRDALRAVDAMSPCVVYCDELEKALAGGHSGGAGDSGVASRLFGSLLSWLSDRESDSFFVGTCNDISRLPPEFARAERLDGVFFLDLPGRAEKDAIWPICLSQFGLDPSQPRPPDRDWTGAEIRACCRLAALLGVSLLEAARNVVPVAATAGEAVERLRSWASGRCLAADRPGVYARAVAGGGTSHRRARRADPSSN
jgi:hypothetical protein